MTRRRPFKALDSPTFAQRFLPRRRLTPQKPMHASRPLVAAVLLVLAHALPARAAADRRVYSTKRTASPPVLDGRVDDAAWQGVEWSGEFVQREPADGKPPTYQTQFKVVYDDAALYFGFKALDPSGDLHSLLARRDRFPG